MKKIITKQNRLDAVREWIDKNSKDLSRKEKLKVYPVWIKIMEGKGEVEMAEMLYREIEILNSKKPKIEKFFYDLKNLFKRLIKKGS